MGRVEIAHSRAILSNLEAAARSDKVRAHWPPAYLGKERGTV